MLADLDYILFVYALGLASIAIILLGLTDTVSTPLPWRWLGWSAAALAVSATADLLSETFHDHAFVAVAQGVCMIVGSLFLLEFGRRCWAAAGGRAVGPWITGVLVVVAALGSLSGLSGLEATAGYCLGLTGGLWGAFAVWRFARAGERRLWSLSIAAVGMAGFTVMEFAVPVAASLPPAEWLNREWWMESVGIPAQLLAMAFSVPFIAGLWYYYRALLREEHPGLEDRRGRVLELGTAAVFFVLVAGGLFVAGVADRHAEQSARDALLGRALLAAGGINPERVASQTVTAADIGTEDYERLREQLALMTESDEDIRWLYLMALRDGRILFGADGIPLDDPGHADPGTPYEEPPPGLAPVFEGSSRGVVVGPYTDEYGTFVSAFTPIREGGDGAVLGVLGVDVDASAWATARGGGASAPAPRHAPARADAGGLLRRAGAPPHRRPAARRERARVPLGAGEHGGRLLPLRRAGTAGHGQPVVRQGDGLRVRGRRARHGPRERVLRAPVPARGDRSSDWRPTGP